MHQWTRVLLFSAVMCCGHSPVLAKVKPQQPAVVAASHKAQVGVASFYSRRFQGKRTASGQIFDNAALTAAHPTLPFGTRVKVTRLKSGQSVIVLINDRGPHVRGRIIDLSRAAAVRIGMATIGTARVRVERL